MLYFDFNSDKCEVSEGIVPIARPNSSKYVTFQALTSPPFTTRNIFAINDFIHIGAIPVNHTHTYNNKNSNIGATRTHMSAKITTCAVVVLVLLPPLFDGDDDDDNNDDGGILHESFSLNTSISPMMTRIEWIDRKTETVKQ